MVTLRFPFLLIIGLFLVLSCSKGQAPVAPSYEIELSKHSEGITSERICWGLWDVILNPDSLTADVVPLRGSNFTANVLNFLQPPKAPIDYLTIKIDPDKTEFSEGYVECDVTIKHPFPGTKFCGFDVMGIIMDDWEPSTFQSDPSIIFSAPPNTLLQNPDGWTRWWNQVEFTTYGTLFGYIEGKHAIPNWTCTHTLNAFKYFCDGLDPKGQYDPPFESRGFFASDDPGVNTRRYKLQFPLNPTPILRFKYAVSANWVAPLPDAEPPYTAGEFPPEANMPEAYKISIINNGSTAYYENEQSNGGYLNFFLEIRDRQLDGDLYKVTDEIESVTIESPTLFSYEFPVELIFTFDPDNPTSIRIPVIINSVTPDWYDDQFLIIKVKSAHPDTYEPQIPGITGFEYPDANLAAYNIVEAPIIPVGLPKSGWPTFHKDNARSGRADFEGPTVKHVRFKFTTDKPKIRGALAVDSQMRAVFQSDYGTVYCVNPDGSLAWSFSGISIDCNNYCGPAIGPDDSIFIGTCSWDLFHISKDGDEIWYRDNHPLGSIDGIVLQDDGSILISGSWNQGGYIAKLNSSGDEIWHYYCNDVPGGPVVGQNGVIYFGSWGGLVNALDQDGNFIWSVDCGDWPAVAPPSLGPNGMYIGSTDAMFYCLDYDGGIVWSKPVSGGISSPACIGSDGNVYVVTGGSNLYSFDQITGDENWSVQLEGSYCCPAPVLDSQNRIYFGSPNGIIYCISPDGGIIWAYPTQNQICSKSPAITDDGTLLVVTRAGNLYAFDNG